MKIQVAQRCNGGEAKKGKGNRCQMQCRWETGYEWKLRWKRVLQNAVTNLGEVETRVVQFCNRIEVK